jgi:hypothetical protein
MAIYVRTAKKSQNTRSSSARSPQPTDAIAPGTAGNNTHLKSGGIAKSQTYRYKLAGLIASEVDHTVVMVKFAKTFGENTSLLEKYDMAVDPSRYICISIYIYQTFCTSPRNFGQDSDTLHMYAGLCFRNFLRYRRRQLAAWERDDWYGHHNPAHGNMYMQSKSHSVKKQQRVVTAPQCRNYVALPPCFI